MPTNYSGRIILILAVLAAALFVLFPSPHKLFDPSIPFAQKHNLKPGIDMVGGTSLLYEIKPPEGGVGYSGELVNQVMAALKKRVDPDGVRNLIWRPQGNTRLEIQMPRTPQSQQAAERRTAFAEAQRRLEATNIRLSEVQQAVEKLGGDARRDKLNALAMGSDRRAELLGSLASTYDQQQQARAAEDFAKDAELREQYKRLLQEIQETNLSAADLQAVVNLVEPKRGEKLAELRKQFENFPARIEAIDKFDQSHARFLEVRGAIDDAADLKRLLKGSGVLEFNILVTDLSLPLAQDMIKRLEERGPRTQAGDEMQWFQVDRPGDFPHSTFDYNDKKWALAYITSDKSMSNRGGTKRWNLERAYPTQSEFGTPVVGFRFDAQGANYFSQLTGTNIGRPLAIALDGKIISAPNIQSQIGRDGIITPGEDGFSTQEYRYLISTLNAGSLPAQLTEEPISERTVGPQLGEDNLRAGLIACYFGLGVVALFLIGYYYIAGVVAMIAVLMNMVLILGVMAGLGATFTLPSVAGIILTIGMAVDANVLIFERLREEQNRGLSLRMALRNAYDRAWSAILDSNVTTGITAAILYWIGSEEVKGFGLTLMIGVVSSLFTALFVTRTIFGLMIDKTGLKKLGSLPLTVPAWDRLLRPNIDWMSKVWVFYIFSIAFIVTGLVVFGIRFAQGKVLDIEFAAGTSVQFELKQAAPIDQVRQWLPETADLPAPSVVSVGTDDRVYEVVTPSADSRRVRDAVLRQLQEKLKIELASSFDMVDQPFETALASRLIAPIESPSQTVADFEPSGIAAYVGGAAVVLNNLDPPLAPEQIKQRIERQRLQVQTVAGTQVYRDFDVQSPTGSDQPTRVAVVLVHDPAFPYDAKNELKRQQWQEQVAGPVWTLVNDAVNKPPQLQKVTNFGPQVAGDARQDAAMAMTLALITIMAYIWVRFGNLRYGTATIVALLHDTLFTIAAIGFAHLLAHTAVGNALLLEPFRLNLTLLAAILTVMGYSMNDTVVVFDRIRENRGKYGHASRQVINDSINQTLSRTLLTGGTTIVTIFVMYLVGGPGIHGFTFALLVGILVGTYSSIAIASPILLVGQARAAKELRKTAVGRLQRIGG